MIENSACLQKRSAALEFIRKNFKGLLVCFLLALPAWFAGKALPVVGGPVFAILTGMLLTWFWQDKTACQPGISFTSKQILQYAVILLGFGMNLSSIMATGKQSLPVIVSTIAVALVAAYILFRILKMPAKISILVGIGSSICGGSAIAATAPIIEADDEEIATAISVIFLFNVIAALIFPTLGGFLGMSNAGFGLFAGTAVNDTSSVTAAAAAWDGIHGSNTLDIAAIVKLTRTLAIIPLTLLLAFGFPRGGQAKTEGSYSFKKSLPVFVIFFILASVITTFFSLPVAITAFLKNLSKFFIIMAMAAIGLNTNIFKLIKSGGKPIFMGFCCWIAIALTSLGMQHLLGIW